MIGCRFYINGTLIDEEPVTWDGTSFIMTRSKEYYGMQNMASVSLKFWKSGAKIIKDIYDRFGIEGKLTFRVDYSCDKGKTWVTKLDGILNCANYTYINGEVTVLFEESDFNRTFKNRIDTVVSLDSTESIDGNALSDIDSKEITLRGKAIVQRTELDVQDGYLDTTQQFSNGDDVILNLPFVTGINDLKSGIDYQILGEACSDNAGSFLCPHTPFYTNTNPVPLLVRLTMGLVDLKIYLRTVPSTTTRVVYPTSGLYLAYGNTYLTNQTLIGGSVLDGTGDDCGHEEGYGDIDGLTRVNEYVTINYATDQYIYLLPNQSIWLYYHFETLENVPAASDPLSDCFNDFALAQNFYFTVKINTLSSIRISSETIFPATKCKTWMVHEAFAKISETITGVKDCFRSEYFGAGNSQPHQYDATGCERYLAVTNGINIRRMKQADGTFYPVNMSFSQLYKMLDSIYCLGMRLEYDTSDAKWYIRVEPRQYFYKNSVIEEFDNVSDIEVKADITYYYNEVEVGFKKWQLNNGQTNGLDEFNTKRSYSVINKNGKNKLSILSEAIAGGYPIEFTRRQQYSNDTTKDFETDNDIFLICLNRVETGVYGIGETNETNELFDTVTNLISPSTAYNLRISPARNMYRWLRWVKASLPRNDFQKIKFTRGEGNYLMVSDHKTGYCEPTCEIGEGLYFEGATNCFNSSPRQLIAPEIISFEIPCNFGIFTHIYHNADKAIRANCSGTVYKGYIDSLEYKPNGADGGTAKFTLVTTPSNGAAFSDGFSDGFDIEI